MNTGTPLIPIVMRPSALVSFVSAAVFYAGAVVSALMLLQHRVVSARLVHIVGAMGFLVWAVNHVLHVRHMTRRLPPFLGFYLAAATLCVFGVGVSFASHTGDGVAVWWFMDIVASGVLVFVVELQRELRVRRALAAKRT